MGTLETPSKIDDFKLIIDPYLMKYYNEVNERLLRYLLKKTLPHQNEFDDIDGCSDFIYVGI